jgi:hypothetical protein
MSLSIETAISDFGRAVKSKLANPAAFGQPEDQIWTLDPANSLPLEAVIRRLDA